MSKYIVYLKSGNSFVVYGRGFSCKWNSETAELTSYKWEEVDLTKTELIYVNIPQIEAVVKVNE